MGTISEPVAIPVVLVPLRDLSVSLAALQLLWNLETRGLSVTIREADGCLYVRPKGRITAADAAAIRQHRDELLALVRYCEEIQ